MACSRNQQYDAIHLRDDGDGDGDGDAEAEAEAEAEAASAEEAAAAGLDHPPITSPEELATWVAIGEAQARPPLLASESSSAGTPSESFAPCSVCNGREQDGHDTVQYIRASKTVGAREAVVAAVSSARAARHRHQIRRHRRQLSLQGPARRRRRRRFRRHYSPMQILLLSHE